MPWEIRASVPERSDLDIVPLRLPPEKPPTVQETIGDLPRIRSGITGCADTYEHWSKAFAAVETVNTKNPEIGQQLSDLIKTLGGNGAPPLGRSDGSHVDRCD